MAGDIVYTVDFQANTSSMATSLKNFNDQVKAKPTVLNISMPNINTSNQANAAAKAVTSMATDLQKITLQQVNYVDQAGKKVTEVIGMTKTWKDSVGDVVTQYSSVASKLDDVYKKTLTKTGTSTITKTGSGVSNDMSKEVNSNIALYDKMNKKVEEWSIRSETMSEKQKLSIQSSGKAVVDLTTEYVRLGKAGDEAGARKLIDPINQANKAFEDSVSATKRSANGVRSWGQSIADAVKQTISYTFSIGLIREAQKLLADSMKYIIELNTEMTKIQILQAEGAKTPEEINSLSLAYNDLAKSLGTTTLEIAKGSVEWLRQGKTIQETTELMVSSTMLSKLGALSASEATEYLTSTLNSYMISAKDATSVVDKLVAVDNQSATSTKELATALRYSAASAKEAGVSLEQLVSYIAVVSSTTRINAESIG